MTIPKLSGIEWVVWKKETTVPPKSISELASITWKSLNFLTLSLLLTKSLANSTVNSDPNTGTLASAKR